MPTQRYAVTQPPIETHLLAKQLFRRESRWLEPKPSDLADKSVLADHRHLGALPC